MVQLKPYKFKYKTYYRHKEPYQSKTALDEASLSISQSLP